MSEALVKLLCESETSGGLLFGVDADRAAAVREGFARLNEPGWEIGLVTAEPQLALL
ncbi:MAG: AIR synthase-related protein [Candidatus Rokuibacteriota bacterium]